MTQFQIPPEIVSKILRIYVSTNPPRLEWLPLRLTNRLFNQELLYDFFVLEIGRSPDFDKFCEPHRPWRKPRGKFVRLITSWLLQGSLLRLPTGCAIHSTQTEAIHQAAARLQEWGEQHPTGPCQLAINSSFSWLPGSHDPSKVSSRAIGIVCNALVRHLGSYGGKEERCRRKCRYKKQPSFGQETPIFVFFLTMCFTGDVAAIEHALKSLNNEIEDAAISLSIGSGLLVAAKEGNESATEFLLSHGADAFTCVNKIWALTAAAKSGKMSLVKILFQPQYNLTARVDSVSRASHNSWSVNYTAIAKMYEQAMVAAANLADHVTREQMTKFFFAHAYDGDLRKACTELLMKAVKFNDLKLAEWIFSTIEMERFQIGPDELARPLEAAVSHRNLQMIRFILNSKPEHSHNPGVDPVIDAAFHMAYQCNYLEGFIELVPLIVPYGPFDKEESLLDYAAGVDGGLDAVSKLAPYDFYAQSMWSSGTVGVWLVHVAARELRWSNLEWLLSRGFRTSKVTEISIDACEERRDDFQRMDKLLKSHQIPGLEICDYLCDGGHEDPIDCDLTHAENTVRHERRVRENLERKSYGKKCRTCW